MTGPILYCGDTELNGAAAYLAGLMTCWDWPFRYVPSNVPMTSELLRQPRSLLIISDYPASQFSSECQKLALEQIHDGSGLLMIGGWESFYGCGGNWHDSHLSQALPVEIADRDDRVNFDQSAWLTPVSDQSHPIIADLPWKMHPPAIGGMNRVVAKSNSLCLLNANPFSVSFTHQAGGTLESSSWSFAASSTLPALVIGQYGDGRSASFMSDVAPHWVGGLVDWGLPRVTAQAKGAPGVEVGQHYAQFWKQLIEWTGNRSYPARSELRS